METEASISPSKCEFSCNLEVDYGSEEIARIVYTALAVDKELQPDKVKRHMLVSNGKLSVHFEAVEARFLRASYSAFLMFLRLLQRVLKNLGKELHCHMDYVVLFKIVIFVIRTRTRSRLYQLLNILKLLFLANFIFFRCYIFKH